jgi:hypothetical protein
VSNNLVITITNTSQAIIQGPWQLVLTTVRAGGLSTGLGSGLGTGSSQDPPFIVNVKNQDLSPGQSFQVVIPLHKPLPVGEQIHLDVLAWQVLVPPVSPAGW